MQSTSRLRAHMCIVGVITTMVIGTPLGFRFVGDIRADAEASQAPQEPAQKSQPGRPEEKQAFDTKGAARYPLTSGIAMLTIGNTWYPIWPSRPDDSFRDSGNFIYPIPVRLEPDPAHPLYDPAERVLRMRLVFIQPEVSSIETSKKPIADYYEKKGEKVEAGRINLIPAELFGYRMSLTVPTEKNPIVIELKGREPNLLKPIDSSGSLPIIKRVGQGETELHDALSNSASDVTLTFVPYYGFRFVAAPEARLRVRQDLIRKSREGVTGTKGRDSTSSVVDKTIQQQISDKTQSEIQVTFAENGADPGDIDDLKALVLKICDSIPKLETDKARDRIESAWVYDTTTGRVELKPEEYKKLTTALQSADDYRNYFENKWNNLVDLATHSEDESKFYKALATSVDNQASGGVSLFDIVEASGAFRLNVAYSSLTNEEQKAVRDFKRKVIESGEFKDDLMRKSYSNWTGQDWVAGSRPKHLNLYRITDAEVAEQFSVAVRTWRVKGEALISREISFQLPTQQPLVPVGGVIMWWGEKNKLPDGFEICDGTEVKTDGPLYLTRPLVKHLRIAES